MRKQKRRKYVHMTDRLLHELVRRAIKGAATKMVSGILARLARSAAKPVWLGLDLGASAGTVKTDEQERKMKPSLGVNPENHRQARVFYQYIGATMDGETRHAEIVMGELAEKLGLRILDRVPQSLFDGWDYWIEFDELPEFPSWVGDYPWKPVGQV